MELSWRQVDHTWLFAIDGREVAWIGGDDGCVDTFTLQEPGLVRWQRNTQQPQSRMQMTAHTLFAPEHTMIPAVLYDGNPWGHDHEYKGYSCDEQVYTFAHHRSSVPGASCSWDNQVSFALYCLQPCSASLNPQADGAEHSVLWPVGESPRTLFADSWGPAWEDSIEPRQQFTVWLCFGDAIHPAWQHMLDHAWRQTWQPLPSPRLATQLWDWSVSYAHLLYSEEEDGLRAFNIGLRWDGTQWAKRPDLKYEIGWCGQNASLAVSLLYDAQLRGNQESLTLGLTVLDSWLTYARSEQGLLLTRYDPPDSLIDACNLGTAARQFFYAYDQATQLGIARPEYEAAGYEICDFALARQQPNGSIGTSWNRDGTLHELEGTTGAFLIPALLEASQRSGNPAYHTAAIRAFSHYYGEFRQKGFGVSGALDTWCIDKESVLPLLRGALMLYHSTGQQSYLEDARQAAWYLNTWQWHQTIVYPQDSPLTQLGYDTFGGTGVSTAHHHMDAFALCYIPDLLELAQLTDDDQWRQRALAIWRNGVMGISDGTLVVLDKDPRPVGSADEGYFQTHWGPGTTNVGFSVSEWLVAWPCAFRLEVLRGSSDWALLDAIGD